MVHVVGSTCRLLACVINALVRPSPPARQECPDDRHGGGAPHGRSHRPADAGVGPVPDDPGQLGDERLHRHRRQGRGDDGDRDPVGNHPLHARHGRVHDHRRQDRSDPGAQARLHDRVPHLRDGLADHVPRGIPARPPHRLVALGGARGVPHHARRGRAGGDQLRSLRAAPRLRAGGVGRRDRGRGRAAGGRAADDLRELAVGLRGRGRDRARHPRPEQAHGRLPARPRDTARPGGHAAVSSGPWHDRLRHRPLRNMGVRAAEARRAAVAGSLPRHLAHPRRCRDPLAVRAVGEPATQAGRADPGGPAHARACRSCRPG